MSASTCSRSRPRLSAIANIPGGESRSYAPALGNRIEDSAREGKAPNERPASRSSLDAEEVAPRNPEARIAVILNQAGYKIAKMEFQSAGPCGEAENAPGLLVAFVERPLSGERMEQIEKRAILETLQACGGNQAQASRMLGISEKTVYNKLRQYRRRTIG